MRGEGYGREQKNELKRIEKERIGRLLLGKYLEM